MELQGGIPLLMQQYKALFRKNLLLAWHNKPATFLQLFSSFFFIFLLFCVKISSESRKSNDSSTKELRDPKTLVVPPIPPCEDKFFIKTPCYDFVWSGKRSKTVGDIVKNIMAKNPGRPIPPEKVLAFNTPKEVDKWLFDNPVSCPAAVHFTVKRGDKISYGIQTNSTEVMKRGVSEDPNFKFQIPLQVAAEREIVRSLIKDPNFPWEVSFKEFPHPPGVSVNEVTLSAMVFFMAVAIFNFVFQISALVTEKELKLRQAMTMMGLFDTAYWLSWISWEALLIFFSSTLIVIFGMMFQFDFFLRNNVIVVWLLFFLFQLTMVTFGYWLSTFLNKAASATNVAFAIFIVGFITMIASQIIVYPYSKQFSNGHRAYWSLFPPNLLTIGLQILNEATESPKDPGISWSTRAKCIPRQPDCVTTMHDIYILHVKTFFFWLVLLLYFDNIIPNISGVRKSKLYFLYPGYWTGKGGSSVKEGGNCSFCSGSLPSLAPITPEDEDVLTEENTVKNQASEGDNSNNAVQIRGLVKTYPGKRTGCCCCCCGKRSPPFHSVKGLWLNVEKDQLLCMLGPNGAGKTTTISCLTGINPVTAGDALVYNQSIRSSMGMANIRRMMGVCPQFDILWDALSGQENLQIFANIKGLDPASVDTVVAQLLSQSKITKVSAKMRSCSYSGGMKRRLSVAIALIGDPKLVILDEPTTGMDPITRRHVWDIIEKAKKGRAIILTTHSMEEADVLSDRIGIMAKGRLRCIGTSIRLKAKFGTGFIANVGLSSEEASQSEAVKHFFRSRLDVVPTDENKSVLTYVIPHDREKLLKEFFAELQARQSELGVKDIQLGLTTLEEVFMNIAKQADVETAIAEGRFKTLALHSGESIEVPVGAQFMGIPGTTSMVEVYWEPDETGSPCIYGQSEEMPIPPNVQLREPPPNPKSPNKYGIVIDPSQLKMH